jgi:hypothetical protein
MFENCNSVKETRAELIKLISGVELSEVQKSISTKFYNVNDIVAFLYNVILTGGNGILYGPGGFGKSEITKAFFEFYGITPFVVVGHSGTDVESLLGIPNIKKLTEESIYEIAFENSIFNNAGILIFEEFLDVKPSVAAALKDIITEGGYRRGDVFIPSKIGSIFICSNKSPEEVTIDFSTGAFYKERFPYSKYVVWDNYSAKSYLNLFKLVYKNKYEEDESAFKLVAELCSSSCNESVIISPRMAFSAMNLFLLNKDLDVFNMIASLDTRKLDDIKLRLRLERQYEILNSKFITLNKLISEFEITNLKDSAFIITFATTIKDEALKYKVENEELLKTISDFLRSLDIKLNEANEKLINLGNKLNYSEITDEYEDIQKFIFK